MKRFALIAAVFACAGCATISLSPFRESMNGVMGRPMQTIFDAIGYPDRQEAIAGRNVYFWGTDQSPCSFKIVATPDGKAATWDGYGSPEGCSFYVRRIHDRFA